MSANSVTVTDAAWVLDGYVDDSESMRHIVINVSPFRIGRAPDLTLSLQCRTVSKFHADIIRRDGTLTITDLGSTNGTFINGERVEGTATLTDGDLVQLGKIVFRVGQEVSEVSAGTIQEDVCDQALVLVQFDKLMTSKGVVPHFQPIIHLDDRRTVGYELLARSHLFGLNEPAMMFRAAAQLNREAELSRLLRWEGVQVSMTLPSVPNLFLNVHPIELAEPGLIESLNEIRAAKPTQVLTLEIHESVVTDAKQMRQLRDDLTNLDIQLAYDDFGAGQARLVELVEIPPDYLKFDIGLVRDISAAPASRQQLVETLVRMVKELGITPLAEGVESAEDGETCEQLGFELAQGFFYGRPAPAGNYTLLA